MDTGIFKVDVKYKQTLGRYATIGAGFEHKPRRLLVLGTLRWTNVQLRILGNTNNA